jgi:hypothetical protein
MSVQIDERNADRRGAETGCLTADIHEQAAATCVERQLH